MTEKHLKGLSHAFLYTTSFHTIFFSARSGDAQPASSGWITTAGSIFLSTPSPTCSAACWVRRSRTCIRCHVLTSCDSSDLHVWTHIVLCTITERLTFPLSPLFSVFHDTPASCCHFLVYYDGRPRAFCRIIFLFGTEIDYSCIYTGFDPSYWDRGLVWKSLNMGVVCIAA